MADIQSLSNEDWNILSFNSYVSERHKLHYISTPKVACTSIKWWFAKLEGLDQDIRKCDWSHETEPSLIIHDCFHRVAPKVTGLSKDKLSKILKSEFYYRFAVVRNPYQRVFSAWQSKVLLREPLQIKPYLNCGFIDLEIECAKDIESAFESFLEFLLEHEWPNILDLHWRPQFNILRPDVIDYTKIAKIENSDELWSEIQRHIGNDYFERPLQRRTNQGLLPASSIFISERSKTIIRKIYKDDFDFFGYPLAFQFDDKSDDEIWSDQIKTTISMIRGRNQRFSEILEKYNEEKQIGNELKKKNVFFKQQNQELSKTIAQYSIHLSEQASEIERMQNSLSWKITIPLRLLRRVLVQRGQNAAKKTWQRLPVNESIKQKIKYVLFRLFPFLFKNTQAYQLWHSYYYAKQPSVLSGSQGACCATDPYVPLYYQQPPGSVSVKLMAFYLPQFHTIPENDDWWGEGFTEWTNVKPARPLFAEHYQPHIPGELGYYDLGNVDVQKRQVELAKLYGLGGFCFYFYWFAGKRLLEGPVLQYLQNTSLDLPFCLCWANENWSRRWDGLDQEILIGQQHSPEDDIAFIEYISKYLHDERYIRIDGKPLLLVYRPRLLPSPRATARRWRQWCRENGIGEIYLAYTQSFETVDPGEYDFDAAIEFPPNNSSPPVVTEKQQQVDKAFSGIVYDLGAIAQRSQNYVKPDYRLFRGVCPAWDNTARRKKNATVFVNNSPANYRQWLENAIADTCQRFHDPDERLVFVNAWNEWAEGAHLEPDQHYGYAWLDMTRRALTQEYSSGGNNRMLIVSHDAHPHGAQFLALGLVRSFVRDLHFQVEVILLDTGRLKKDFAAYAPVHDLVVDNIDAESLALELAERGFDRAIVNSTVSGAFAELINQAGIECISLVHELPGVIHDFQLQEKAKAIADTARYVVFPSEIVAHGFAEFAQVSKERQIIRPQGLWRRNLCRYKREQARRKIRQRLDLSENAPVVLAVGYADKRKGVDLFVQAGLKILKMMPDTFFIWIGHWDESAKNEVDKLIVDAGAQAAFRFLGYEPDTAVFHAGADIYALSSREDPFPNVVLESFDAGIPVVAFQGTGGGAELVSRLGGMTVTQDDALAYAEAIMQLLRDSERAANLGRQAMIHVDKHYAFRNYLFDLCALAGTKIPRISVIVPNYNYAQYIEARLDSIRQQTVPFFELIILDDASTDASVDKIIDWLSVNNIEARLEINDTNSGNVFEQWAKGLSMATGEYVWIAEADDLCYSNMLDLLLQPFSDPDVVLSYCESEQIDRYGHRMTEHYQDYYQDISGDHWKKAFVSRGRDEKLFALSIKNTIPNVSGVLFKRGALAQVIQENLAQIKSFKRAGDWLIYIKLLNEGKIAFNPSACNKHRRHDNSVISGSVKKDLIQEIRIIQELVAKELPLTDEVVTKASRYLGQLEAQFELDEG